MARPSISAVTASAGKVKLDKSDTSIKTVSGDGFVAKFDMETGTIYSLAYGGKTIIADGNGPKLDALRALPITTTGSIRSGLNTACITCNIGQRIVRFWKETTVRSSWLSLSNRRRRTVLRSKVEPVREKIV